jgi:hypothetical protein
MSALKKAALRYARAGVSVLPCNGKRAILEHGFLDASADPELVEEWWTERPTANVAIHPGSAGLLVIDVDVKVVDGHESLSALEREHGGLPDTRIACTPSTGIHLYFKVPTDERFGNAKPAGVDGGIDIRCSAGYVLAPPSSICGKPYRWTNTLKAATLPDAWVELLREKPYVAPEPTERPERVKGNGGGNLRKFLEVAYTEEGNELASAHEGDRNNALNRYGFSLGQLVHLGLKVEDIIEQAEWAASQWSWSHGRRDARKDRATIERAIQDGMRSPRKVAGHE